MAKFVPGKYLSGSRRIPGHDYSKGIYYFTICTQHKMPLFGKILSGQMHLSQAGKIADSCWFEIPSHYPHVKLYSHVIMPDHIHGIIEIIDRPSVELASRQFPTWNLEKQNPTFYTLRSLKLTKDAGNKYQKIIPGSLGSIVRGFKIGVTNYFRANSNNDKIWQRNFHERMLRNRRHFDTITRYIINNPKNWKDF
jgi:putative transposase